MYKIWTHNGCKTKFLQTGTDVTIQEIVTINVAHHSYSGPKRPNVTCLTRSHAFRKMNETQQVTMYFSLTAKINHPTMRPTTGQLKPTDQLEDPGKRSKQPDNRQTKSVFSSASCLQCLFAEKSFQLFRFQALPSGQSL